jgi:hypothetical protein
MRPFIISTQFFFLEKFQNSHGWEVGYRVVEDDSRQVYSRRLDDGDDGPRPAAAGVWNT